MVEPQPNADIDIVAAHSPIFVSKLMTNVLPGEFALDNKNVIVQYFCIEFSVVRNMKENVFDWGALFQEAFSGLASPDESENDFESIEDVFKKQKAEKKKKKKKKKSTDESIKKKPQKQLNNLSKYHMVNSLKYKKSFCKKAKTSGVPEIKKNVKESSTRNTRYSNGENENTKRWKESIWIL